MWLLNQFFVTESISGSAVPLAMFYGALIILWWFEATVVALWSPKFGVLSENLKNMPDDKNTSYCIWSSCWSKQESAPRIYFQQCEAISSPSKMISFEDFLFWEFHSDITFVAVMYWNGKLDIVKEFYSIKYFLRVWNIMFSLTQWN